MEWTTLPLLSVSPPSGSAGAVGRRRIRQDSVRPFHSFLTTRALSSQHLCSSDAGQLLEGWEVVVFPAIDATMAACDSESVRRAWSH